MARPITYKIIDEFYRAREAVSEGNGNIFFRYEEVVEAVRKSPYAYRFDFETYDNERANGHNATSLYFKFIDKEYGTEYSYPTYRQTKMFLRRFNLSYRMNRALPRIDSPRYYCKYRTIEQLLAMLAIVVPKIDELEKEILEDEQIDLRKRRVQEIFSATVPDLVKSSFEGTGLGYWYKMKRDSISLKIRLPKNLHSSFEIKFKKLSEGLQYAIEASRNLSSTIERYGTMEIEKYSAKSIQWTEGL